MAMVPLDPAAVWHVRSWLGPPDGPGLLALQHALAYRLPGLWGAPAASPRSVLLVREGTNQIEAFGAGEPEPAAGWLLRSRRPFVLHAPDTWHDAVRGRLGDVEEERVETWTGPGVSLPMIPPPPRRSRTRPARAAGSGSSAGSGSGPSTASDAKTKPGAPAGVPTRRLLATDAAAFARAAPPWALRGWRTYAALIEQGAAFGVPHGSEFVSLAWVFDSVDNLAALGVSTLPRFRRLGLGRAVVSSLIEFLVRERNVAPFWSTIPENVASSALAHSLGFSVSVSETLLRWPPRSPADEDPETDG